MSLGPSSVPQPSVFDVGEHRFTEDWGIFQVDQAKPSDDFQGNKLDLSAFLAIYPIKIVYLNFFLLYLRTKLAPPEFTVKCFPRGDANWEFKYPIDRLIPFTGILTDELVHNPRHGGSGR